MTAASLDCLRGGPVQIAYGVDDVHRAVVEWESRGAGPFVVRAHIEVTPNRFDHSSAYGWWGSIMVELVHVHRPAELAEVGLHHVAFFVDSFSAAVAELDAAGFPQVLLARAGSTDFAFHDARDSLGHLIEIYEQDERLQAFYDHIRSLHLKRSVPGPLRLT